MMNNRWFVYILRCADGSLYTGVTNDLKRRIKRHNDGLASRYTRSRLPIELAYQEYADSRSEAQKREAEIKKWTRSKKIALISTKNRH